MPGSIKVLLVRDFFLEGRLLNSGLECSTATVIEIEPGKELPLGFARLVNVDGEAVFRMTQETDAVVLFTSDEKVPHTILNGEDIISEMESIFHYGSIVVTYVGYQQPYYVSRDTVALLPPGTPAQFTA